MPFTLRNLREDLADVGSNFDGAPDLEFRLASKALELEQSGLSYQRIPPNYRFPYGHTHKTQEEIYVVAHSVQFLYFHDLVIEFHSSATAHDHVNLFLRLVRVAVRKAIIGRDALVAQPGLLELKIVGRHAEFE